MPAGFKIIWTQAAEAEFDAAVEYLEEFFTEKEVQNLFKETNRMISLISERPKLFSISDDAKIRKVVIARYITLYYSLIDEEIHVISFFSNRRSPENRNFKQKKFPKACKVISGFGDTKE